jgi:hypothetical protein
VKKLLAIAGMTIALVVACSPGGARWAQHGSVDWNRYYSSNETARIMYSYARHYPDLARVYPIGTSYMGERLLMMEVTNRSTGPADEKPALYVDGNIHSGELTGSAVTLYLMGQLLDGYGTDPRITELVDTRTFYLRPKFNPDGADLALLQDVSLRSTVHPRDNDGDGEADEDPGEDLNGDGAITRMRIPDPEGTMRKSDEDPRVMVRRGPDDNTGPFYRVVGEGIDNDGDGRLNEDGIGGLDMNRNFPRNWELEYLQSGAGDYPLSEPETRATVAFINDHPNIVGIVHNHTSGGFVYRLPSASDPTKFDTDDLALIELLGARYTETTGRPVRPSSTDPTRHRYGTLISWAYWDKGVIGWVPEYWPGIDADEDGDGGTSELERLRYVDRELGGRYFMDWQPYEHPEFGPVEIGGWKSKFISQNPPPELLEEECALQIPWILYLIEQSPRLELNEPVVRKVDDLTYEVRATVRNVGFLPTNLTQRGINARVVAPVVATLEVEGAEIVSGGRRVRLGHLAGSYPVPDAGASTSATVVWQVRAEPPDATVQIVFTSEKGGTVRSARLPIFE